MKSTRFGVFAALQLVGAGSALATVHYVNVNSTNATPPYANWFTAATNIQDAVDAAVGGDEVVVTNGVYAAGGRSVDGYTYNRVKVDQPVNIRSVNGPEFTTIVGGGRCVQMTDSASLSGFTLSGGEVDNSIFGESVYGAGVYGGTLNNCTIVGNSVLYVESNWDGGTVYDGAYGGGAAFCTLNNCTLADNYAFSDEPGSLALGGGAYYCTLNNCTLNGNWVHSDPDKGYAYAYGGGAYYCALNNCILTRNSVTGPAGIGSSGSSGGGGAFFSTLHNCISFRNGSNGSCEDCYSPDPLLVDPTGWDFRLQSNSPCINAGNNAFIVGSTDLAGNPRIVGSTVDIGAYEYQSLSLINFSVISNQAGFSITGQSNQAVVVEASADLANWFPLATNTLSAHPFLFSDPAPGSVPRRFYRALAQ